MIVGSLASQTVVPRVAIGLPVFNGERFVTQAIESICGQSFTDWQLLICDNASTDSTSSICLRFAHSDPRIRYHRNDRNIGASPNFNLAFELSPPAPYFRWASCDDLIQPGYLRACVDVLDASPHVVVCHSDTGVMNEFGDRIHVPDRSASNEFYDPPRRLDDDAPSVRLHDLLLRTLWCFEIFGMIRRDLLVASPMLPGFYGNDKVLLAWLILRGRFATVPQELFLRRYHSGATHALKSARARAEWMDPAAGLRKLFPRVQCLAGYLGAIRSAPLSSAERRRCYQVALRYTMQVEKWRKVLGLAPRHASGQTLPT